MTTDDYPQKITFGEMRASGVRDVGLLPRSPLQPSHQDLGLLLAGPTSTVRTTAPSRPPSDPAESHGLISAPRSPPPGSRGRCTKSGISARVRTERAYVPRPST